MYICTVCMWERVTYPAVPFALDLEGGAGRSKSLRILSKPKEGHGARGYAAYWWSTCMYVCMHAYENISIYMYVCMHVCMYVDDFQPVELSRYSILGSDLLRWLTPLPWITIYTHTYIHTCHTYMPIHVFQDARTHLGPCSSQLELETARKHAVN